MEAMMTFDVEIFRSINNLAGALSWLNPLMIFFAKYAIFVLAIWMILLWVIKPRMRKPLLAAFIAFLIAALLAKITGKLYYHVQPFANPDLPDVFQLINKNVGNAFPSDHTAVAFAVCVALFMGSKSKGKFLYLLTALLIGVSRIWVGVHYPLDVLAGLLIGTIVALIIYPLVMRSQFFDAFIAFFAKLEQKIIGRKGKHQSR